MTSHPEYDERLGVPLRWWVQGTMLVATLWLAVVVATPPVVAWTVTGLAMACLVVAFVSYGYLRHREVEAALSRGEYTSLANRAAVVFAGVGALLGVATMLLVLLHTT